MTDRGDDNRFTPQFADEEFIDAVETLDDATTRAVAEIVGCQKETARQRLKDLAQQGDMVETRVGYQAVWKLPNP